MNKLQSVKRACEIGDKVYSQILKKLRVGVSEKEISREIVRMIRTSNARLAFRPIVAFGKNAAEPHHKATNKKLNKNDGFIKIDLGAKFNGYCSDMTRTIFIGRPNTRQKKIYKTVLLAQQKAIKKVKANVKTYELDKIARNYIVKLGFDPIPHSLGHGVGKKVHEKPRLSPVSNEVLENGTIFTIEPGIYIKGYGGVRIEDTFYLNKGKLIQLTKSPKNLIEIEI